MDPFLPPSLSDCQQTVGSAPHLFSVCEPGDCFDDIEAPGQRPRRRDR